MPESARKFPQPLENPNRVIAWLRGWGELQTRSLGERDKSLQGEQAVSPMDRNEFLGWAKTSLYEAELALHNGDRSGGRGEAIGSEARKPSRRSWAAGGGVPRRPKWALVVLAMLVLAPTSSSAAAPEISPAWTFTSQDTIRWYTVAHPGVLVVGTDESIVGLGTYSGKAIWWLEGIKDPRPGDLRFVSDSLVWVTLLGRTSLEPKSFLMDVRDGRRMWSADDMGFTEWFGGFRIPNTSRYLMGAGLPPDGSRRVIAMVDLRNGATVWKTEEFFEDYRPPLFDLGGRPSIAFHQPPLPDSDSTFIVFMSKHWMRKYNARNGAILWEARVDSVRGLLDPLFENRNSAALHYGFAKLMLSADRQRFFAPFQNAIGCYSTRDGHGLWEKPPRLPGVVTQMAEVPDGLLVWVINLTEPRKRHLLLLDTNTGEVRWRTPHNLLKNFWESTSNILIEDRRAFVAAEGRLFSVDLESGKDSIIARLGFKGDDPPGRLEARRDGFLVSGAQNLVLAGSDGRPVFQFFRHAPGGSPLGATLLAMTSVLAIAASEMGDRVWVSRDDYIHLMEAVGAVASGHGESFVSSDGFWILADQTGARKKPGLVRVNKADGRVIGEVPLGEPLPDYKTDEAGRVFVRPDGMTIRCFQVEKK